MRVRKAWEVRLKDFDYGWHGEGACIFAPTASKARYQGLIDIRDAYCDTTFADILVRRWPARDVKLPEPDARAEPLTERQRHDLLHAYGASHGPYKAGFRNHFYCQQDNPDLLALVGCGMMTGPHRPWGDQHGDQAYFYLTDDGKHVAASLLPVYAR